MKLKELRKRNKLTQEDVAKIINKSAIAYGYYESGKNEPDISTLIKLADYFHVSVDELIEHSYQNTIDKGLLNETELSVIEVMKELNKDNQNRLEAFAMALYQTQNDNDRIAARLREEIK